jgi:hypothetical protein
MSNDKHVYVVQDNCEGIICITTTLGKAKFEADFDTDSDWEEISEIKWYDNESGWTITKVRVIR